MKTTNQFIESQQGLAKGKILYCKHDSSRGVLLSNPPQEKCMREGCYQTWVVGKNPPVCKMFDVEKFTDTLITQIIQNTGEELLRGVEDINTSTTIGFIKPEDQKGYRQAQTDIKKHIASVTGV